MPKLLFLLRFRDASWNAPYSHNPLSSGLFNSVRFLVDMLNLLGIQAKMVSVQDSNFIDKEVHSYRPTHCIIEAFWCPPEKFDVLKKLHPTVTWMVRDHSETPFLAMEGMTFGWIAEYLKRGIEVTCNSPRALIDLQALAKAYNHPELISYTPNYYPIHAPADFRFLTPKPPTPNNIIKIGCFGAIRPLKNHMVQAIASLRYSQALGKKLEFHINGTRIEGGANPILNNLRSSQIRREPLLWNPPGWIITSSLTCSGKWIFHCKFHSARLSI